MVQPRITYLTLPHTVPLGGNMALRSLRPELAPQKPLDPHPPTRVGFTPMHIIRDSHKYFNSFLFVGN